jgi:hypothetical protein
MSLLQVSSALVSVLGVSHVKQMSRSASDLALELGLDQAARVTGGIAPT